MIGAWWDKAQRSMWPPSVVVGAVSSEDGPQVPLAEDQNAVGEFGSDGQDEPFGEAVHTRTSRWNLDVSIPAPPMIRTRTSRWNLHVSIPAPPMTLSKAVVNCPAQLRTRNWKVA